LAKVDLGRLPFRLLIVSSLFFSGVVFRYPYKAGCCIGSAEGNFRLRIERVAHIRAPVVQVLVFGPINSWIKEERHVQVFVRDNNVDQALKALKKKMQREGLFREMKLRGHYEKPSERRAREKAEAIRRARKLARKKLQREGLLPMKPRVNPGQGRGGPPRAPRF
jgi:small subunit ribosomal protein S21